MQKKTTTTSPQLENVRVAVAQFCLANHVDFDRVEKKFADVNKSLKRATASSTPRPWLLVGGRFALPLDDLAGSRATACHREWQEAHARRAAGNPFCARVLRARPCASFARLSRKQGGALARRVHLVADNVELKQFGHLIKWRGAAARPASPRQLAGSTPRPHTCSIVPDERVESDEAGTTTRRTMKTMAALSTEQPPLKICEFYGAVLVVGATPWRRPRPA